MQCDLPLSRPRNVLVPDNQQSDRENRATPDTQNLIHLYSVLRPRRETKQPASQFDYVDKIFVICWVWNLRYEFVGH